MVVLQRVAHCSDRLKREIRTLSNTALVVLGATVAGSVFAMPAPSAGAARIRWTFGRFHPVSQPVAVGGRFVLYAAGAGGLRVVALDPSSGAVAWTSAASTSAITPGVPPTLLAVDGAVIVLRPVSAQEVRLVAIDARTGAQRWASPAGFFTDWPKLCPGERGYICDNGSASAVSSIPTAVLRFRLRDGQRSRGAALSTSASLGPPRTIGPGLFDTGARAPETLEAATPTKRVWLRPLADIFGIPDASTDNGWDVDRVSRVGLFVGSVVAARRVSSTSGFRFDFAAQETVGFSIATGSVSWTDLGSFYVCTQPLPCAGEFSSMGPIITLRLRATGTLTAPAGGGTPTLSPDASVAVEGFDPATGKTRWSFNAGRDVSLLTEFKVPPQVSSDVLALPGAIGPVALVDLATGAISPATESVVAWCRSPTSYHENVGYPGPVGPITRYVGDDSFRPCDASGRPVPIPSRIPIFVGARLNGVTVFSERTRVIAVSR